MRNNPGKYTHHPPLGLILPLVGLMTGLACPGYLSSQQLTHEGGTSSSANPGWVATGSLGTARQGHTATLLPNGEVLVTGGTGVGYCIDIDFVRGSTEIYEPATGAWRSTESLSIARYGHTATLLRTGHVLVAGGINGYCLGRTESIGSTELYDPATGLWRTTGSLLTTRRGHTAILLEDGRVMVVGGQEIRTLSDFPRRTTAVEIYGAELYDPATETWTSTAPRTIPFVHTAMRLPNGKVLAIGRSGSCNSVVAAVVAELYDPGTGQWSATRSPSTIGCPDTATLLANGQVLVTGASSAELSDPATGGWSKTVFRGLAGSGATATLLASGQVLVAGGQDGDDHVAVAELYDPATGRWSPASTLNTSRGGHTATLLPNGKVLAAGGRTGYCCDYHFTLNSAELYDVPFEPPALAVDSSKYCVGATWTLLVTSAAPNSPVRLLGTSNGESWEIARWGTTGVDGIFTTSGTMAEGTQGRHSLRVEISGLISTINTFEVTSCK